MDLILYVILLALSLLIISIGLFRPEHTEMALIGFVFLFLLSLNMEVGTVTYKIGTDANYTYVCQDVCETGNYSVLLSQVQERDIYGTFTAGGVISHLVGYWLAVMSIIGFVGVLLNLRHNRGFK